MMSPVGKLYPVSELWRSLNPAGFGEGVFLVLQGYIDESYDDDTFVLSCTVGTGAQWQNFELEWASVLADWNARLALEKRPLLSRYHATDCNGGWNEFRGWHVEEQKELTASLLTFMTKEPMLSVAYTVLLKDIRSVTEERFGRPVVPENVKQAAYLLTTQFCLGHIGETLWARNRSLRLTVIHDRSDYDGIMLWAFNKFAKDRSQPWTQVLSTIAPMNSRECLPLQLADFLAFEFFRDRGGEELRGAENRRRKSLSLFLKTDAGVSLRTLTPSVIRQIMDANAAVV